MECLIVESQALCQNSDTVCTSYAVRSAFLATTALLLTSAPRKCDYLKYRRIVDKNCRNRASLGVWGWELETWWEMV